MEEALQMIEEIITKDNNADKSETKPMSALNTPVLEDIEYGTRNHQHRGSGRFIPKR